jgi:hypothetical protein
MFTMFAVTGVQKVTKVTPSTRVCEPKPTQTGVLPECDLVQESREIDIVKEPAAWWHE